MVGGCRTCKTAKGKEKQQEGEDEEGKDEEGGEEGDDPLENLFPSYCSRINRIWTCDWTQLGGSQRSSTVFGIHYLPLYFHR